jgi:hypothetical protein
MVHTVPQRNHSASGPQPACREEFLHQETRMNNVQHRLLPRPSRALVIVLVALGSYAVLAESQAGTPDAKRRYQRESAACAAIRMPDDRANCLSEASTRFAGTQPAVAAEQADILASNALKRCERLPADERLDCVARMKGQGSTSGSVGSGGIYRELVTREVQ